MEKIAVRELFPGNRVVSLCRKTANLGDEILSRPRRDSRAKSKAVECPRNVEHPGNMKLTRREMECIYWAAQGKTEYEVAVIIGVSRNTVNFHKGNFLRKLGAVNTAHAVAKAIRMNLI